MFSEKWDKKYPAISRSWHKNWSNIVTLFDYPDDIRKIIYTTNAILSTSRFLVSTKLLQDQAACLTQRYLFHSNV